MSETEFATRIDAAFPLDDPARAAALIAEAGGISHNALFIALEEICRAPGIDSRPAAELDALIDLWQARARHPLAARLASVARQLGRGQTIPLVQALALAQAIGAHPGQRAALNIVYFACEDDTGRLDALDAAIRQRWDAAQI